MLRIKNLSIFILLSVLWTSANATHHLGGEMFYTCFGNNQYQVTARLYVDCIHGDPTAVAQDVPMFISVFDSNGVRLLVDSLPLMSRLLLPAQPGTTCLKDTSAYCILVSEFRKTFTLPAGGPYTIINQRCCVPDDITNIKDPRSTGLTLQCVIPATGCNNSAVFSAKPVMRFPTNKQFLIDLSATDPDGDSLVYRLVHDYAGGTPLDAKTIPTLVTSADLLQYANSYSAQYPLGNAGILHLNSHTGHLTGVCYHEGEYFVSVACDEYRNGTLINTVERSLSYSFGDYDREVTAMFSIDGAVFSFADQDSIFMAQCNGDRTIHFGNGSKGATSYQWSFGDSANVSAGSSSDTPVYTYPGAGKYLVTLIAFGPNCSDTTQGYVLINSDSVDNDFIVSGGPCILQQFHFSDNTNSHGNTVTGYEWIIDGVPLSGQNVDMTMIYPGTKKATHIVTTAHGCVSASAKDVNVVEGQVNAGNDTTVATGTMLQLTASGSSVYTWTAMPGAIPINSVSGATAMINCISTGTNMQYVVTGIDNNGCGGIDTVAVTVSSTSYVHMPNAFTPNNDGLNDVLKPFLSSYTFDEMHVFNRSGQQVFYTTDPNAGWDGLFKGNPAPVDGYLWVVKAHNSDGQKQTFKGNVTLIR